MAKRLSAEYRSAQEVFGHSEVWRDIATAMLLIVAISATTVLYVLAR